MKLYQVFLDEFKMTTYQKNTRQAKISRAAGHLATTVAKEKDDPLYKKMVYHRELYKSFKARLRKKYQSRVKPQSRR